MDIFKLYRTFWDYSFKNPEKIKPNDIAIYSFAIEHCNRLGWKDKFGFPTSLVMEATGIKSYSVYKKHFDNLVNCNFIEVIEYSKNQYSSNIIALKENCKALDKALDKALIKHETKQSESTEQSTKQSIDSIDKQINKETKKQRNNKTESNDSSQNEILEDTQKLPKEKFTLENLKTKSTEEVFELYKQNKKDIVLNIALWNAFAKKYNKSEVVKITDARKKKLKLRLLSDDFSLDKILEIVKIQSFAMKNSWFGFDFIIENETNYVKILEKKYLTNEQSEKEPKKGDFTI